MSNPEFYRHVEHEFSDVLLVKKIDENQEIKRIQFLVKNMKKDYLVYQNCKRKSISEPSMIIVYKVIEYVDSEAVAESNSKPKMIFGFRISRQDEEKDLTTIEYLSYFVNSCHMLIDLDFSRLMKLKLFIEELTFLTQKSALKGKNGTSMRPSFSSLSPSTTATFGRGEERTSFSRLKSFVSATVKATKSKLDKKKDGGSIRSEYLTSDDQLSTDEDFMGSPRKAQSTSTVASDLNGESEAEQVAKEEDRLIEIEEEDLSDSSYKSTISISPPAKADFSVGTSFASSPSQFSPSTMSAKSENESMPSLVLRETRAVFRRSASMDFEQIDLIAKIDRENAGNWNNCEFLQLLDSTLSIDHNAALMKSEFENIKTLQSGDDLGWISMRTVKETDLARLTSNCGSNQLDIIRGTTKIEADYEELLKYISAQQFQFKLCSEEAPPYISTTSSKLSYSFKPVLLDKKRHVESLQVIHNEGNSWMRLEKSFESTELKESELRIYLLALLVDNLNDGVCRISCFICCDFKLPTGINNYLLQSMAQRLGDLKKIAESDLSKSKNNAYFDSLPYKEFTISSVATNKYSLKIEQYEGESFNGELQWSFYSVADENANCQFSISASEESFLIRPIVFNMTRKVTGCISVRILQKCSLLVTFTALSPFKKAFKFKALYRKAILYQTPRPFNQQNEGLVQIKTASTFRYFVFNLEPLLVDTGSASSASDSTGACSKFLFWEFSTFGKDLTFGIIFYPFSASMQTLDDHPAQGGKILLPFAKANSQKTSLIKGTFPLSAKMRHEKIAFVWNNESNFSTKQLYYRLGINVELL